MNFRLKDAVAPFYLGGALSAFGHIHWHQWEFYAIVVPFFILVKVTDYNNPEK
jgi:1,4-dihydroxy-2-naphthoate octaprenyltransferase